MAGQRKSTKGSSKTTQSQRKRNNSSGSANAKSSAKSKTATQKKSSSSKSQAKTKNKLHALIGEISVSTTSLEIEVNKGEEFISPALWVDKKGNAFGRSMLEIEINGTRKMLPMDAKQAGLLLKLLGVVPYA